MKNILYIFLLIGFSLSSQVNLSTYGAVGDGVTDDTAAIQNAFDNETNITSDAAKTYLVSSQIRLDQNLAQTIDFNGSTITRNVPIGYPLWIDKSSFANSLTTISNLNIDGNDLAGSLLYIESRTQLTNVDIYDARGTTGGTFGVYIIAKNEVGAEGQWVFDDVNINNITHTGTTSGESECLYVYWPVTVTNGMQFVYKNSSVSNSWGYESNLILLTSALHDISFTNNSLWFENMTLYNFQRRAVKNYIGNTTWINSDFYMSDVDNPDYDFNNYGISTASLFDIGAASSATGSENNLICGCNFYGGFNTNLNGGSRPFQILATTGTTSVEIRRSTFNGDSPNIKDDVGYNGINMWTWNNGTGNTLNDVSICGATFTAATTTARGNLINDQVTTWEAGKKLQVDSNNTYSVGETAALARVSASKYDIVDLSGSCAVCPTILPDGGEVSVTGVKTYPTEDKMLVSGTRQLYKTIEPETASDITGSWSTSNGAVATVSSNGLVTATGTGSCTITFTTTDESFTDTTAITVESSSTEDSILVLKPQGYYDGSAASLKASSWDDISGFELHGTEVGTIAITGNQATFDGASYYDITDTNGFLDYMPGVDEYTIIFREGDTSPTSGYPISKNGGAGFIQYGVVAYSSSNMNAIYNGGSGENLNSPEVNNNRLLIATVSTTNVNVWVDGSQVITNSTAVGSQTTTASVNIGGFNDGSFLLNNGSTLDIVATIPKVISTGEREAIEAEFQVNGAAVSASTKPTGGTSGDPVYWLNSVKKFLKGN